MLSPVNQFTNQNTAGYVSYVSLHVIYVRIPCIIRQETYPRHFCTQTLGDGRWQEVCLQSSVYCQLGHCRKNQFKFCLNTLLYWHVWSHLTSLEESWLLSFDDRHISFYCSTTKTGYVKVWIWVSFGNCWTHTQLICGTASSCVM